MKRFCTHIIEIVLLALFVIAAPQFISSSAAGPRTVTGDGYNKVLPPSWYGSVVMKKNIKAADGVAPVVFKHWAHRRFYTCNVCHKDLGFAWKAGFTDIRHSDIESGGKCGACHNGREAFSTKTCNRCHSYGKKVVENSGIKEALRGFPASDFGNKVDWVKALHENKITPKSSLDGKGQLKALKKDVVLPAYARSKFSAVPPDVLFPHKSHTEVLDCAACHPGRFKAKEGGNAAMDMMKIIDGEYCGACHGKVAFPLENCFRCHSVERAIPDWITGADVVKEKAAAKAEADKKAKEEEEKKKKQKKKKKKRKTLF